MRSTRAILSVKYTVVGPAARRAVAGFLHYIQYRDHRQVVEGGTSIEQLTRYVAYRDAASPQGRLFNEGDTVGDAERKALAAYVRRSTAGVKPGAGRSPRAVYRLVLSPEDARGLDLRAVARASMDQLARDAGGLPHWIAAEHRNTAHPHVHVVLPAWRETAPGRYRQLLITKPRLASMKAAMSQEIARQRGLVLIGEPANLRRRQPPAQQWHHGPRRRRHRPIHLHLGGYGLGRLIHRLADHYRRQAEREAAELERLRERERRQGRDRGD